MHFVVTMLERRGEHFGTIDKGVQKLQIQKLKGTQKVQLKNLDCKI